MPERRLGPRGRRLALRGLLFLALLAASALLVGEHVHRYPQVSHVDELSYIDYLFTVNSGHLVHTGQLVGQDAMRETACRGLDATFPLPSCSNATFRPESFPGRGVNTAEIHPPLYFVATAIAARALKATGIVTDLVSAARAVGALWLAAGALLAWIAAELLGARLPSRIGMSAILVGTVNAHYASYVTPDATNVFVGALVLLAALSFDRRRAPVWALALAGAVAAAMKAPNLLIVGAMSLFLALRGLFGGERLRPERRLLLRHLAGAFALSGGAIVTELAWQWARSATAVAAASSNPVTSRYHVRHLTPQMVEGQTLSLLRPFNAPGAPGHWTAVALLGLLVASVGGAWFYGRRADPVTFLAVGLAVMMLAGGPLLVVATYLGQGIFVGLPNRYGLSLLPGQVAVLAAAAGAKVMAVFVGAFGVTVYAYTLYAFTHHWP